MTERMLGDRQQPLFWRGHVHWHTHQQNPARRAPQVLGTQAVEFAELDAAVEVDPDKAVPANGGDGFAQ